MDKEEQIFIVNQFRRLVDKALNNYHIDLYRKYLRKISKETPSDNPVNLDEGECDPYNFLENQTTVMNFKMTVTNDLLYELLESYEQKQRDIIYLSLCEKWSDFKIGELMNMSRSKVQRIKQKVKNEIYNKLIGASKHED